MFVNISTADDKYSFLNRDTLRQPIQMQLSQKQKAFSEFVPAFWDLNYIFNIFKRKMTLVADVFAKLGSPKYVGK